MSFIQFASFRTLCTLLALVFSLSTTQASQLSPLWLEAKGEGTLSVIFISGNGNDSTVWKDVEPVIRDLGVRTVVYDRAGLGKSPLWEGDYTVQGEADDLRAALSAHAIDGPIIIVAHSYGGYITALLSEDMQQLQGIVLVDAGLSTDLTLDVLQYIHDEYTPQFEAVEKAAPKLAKAVIPVVKAFPATAKRMQSVTIPKHLPVIDILAETSWLKDPQLVKEQRKIHADFVAASPTRSSLIAKGSGHNVMKDKPEYVVDAVTQMLEQVR
ncbi:hypothetical protein GCM10007094_34660 [Pseudovibrio japonicus]|uniref:AB hydrolase-1 domain-containing protein n=1 Tax=Pseudovibrio japonicus TaxID=366534 RepID=A0ABQ3EMS0_9HYPH|nr:alpha/beta hydrolase [Pseudovibrio japonicus]GHB42472.1 hypothetical protein GCM10007094_34660 [Pseudovibrio japonicus]